MSRRRRTYTPEQIAAALAALELNGGALRQTAREFGVPVMTLASWRGAVHTYVQETKSWPDRIRELWEQCLEAGLRASIAIAEQAQDRAWLDRQNAHDVAILAGVLQDKARLLTEAARRAGVDQQRQLPPSPATPEGGVSRIRDMHEGADRGKADS